VRVRITGIDEQTPMPIRYPNALYDEDEPRWISDAGPIMAGARTNIQALGVGSLHDRPLLPSDTEDVGEPLWTARCVRAWRVLRHVEEVSGNVAMTCRYYWISRLTYSGWLRRYETEGAAPPPPSRWRASAGEAGVGIAPPRPTR
jgi:hypothetical protein